MDQAVAEAPAVPSLLPLEVDQLTLEIDGKRLLDRVDLTLSSGSFTVVMGQNGAGKSLLLRLLHGLLRPTSGQIRWAGTPLGDAVRKRQGMVFQKPVLLRRSVAANIDFVLGLRRSTSTERRDALLDHVGLLAKARQPARLLSGGEQQRLALARVLALDPDVLFLDEPTASLDPASVITIEEIVGNVHRLGTKIIFITHDIGQAKRLADDVVFLHRGRVEEQSTADCFFDGPRSPVAKAYLAGRVVI